ncbi:MAG TPA: ABC transporter permease [Candidatus Saccharibacteria bacterium]|nr:ABC transporter permease [Candidatus Saccharibacteria bacterium]
MSKLMTVFTTRREKSRQYKSIPSRVLLYIAWRNFISKKLRSFLTVFGVIIGVSAIFFLLSFGLGVQSLVTNQVVGDKSLKSIDVTSPNSKIIKLNEDTTNKMRTYPHVSKVGVQYSFPGIMSYNGGEVDAVVYGQNQEYQSLSSLALIKGRLLNNVDSHAVLLNTSALKALGIDDPNSALNKVISIDIPLDRVEAKKKQISDKFTVVGIIESGAGSEIFMPSNLFDIAGVPTYSQVKVVMDDTANVATARKQIEASGFQTASLTDTLSEIDNIFRFFNLVLIGFGSIGMIVAVLGMFNTLTISLLERTKEIGLMMALGSRRRDMRKLFIFEAALISFFGAVIGVLIAYIIGKVVNLYINLGAASRGVTQSFELFATPWWSIVTIILATVVVGLLVVYFPARRAERINPIDALRRE